MKKKVVFLILWILVFNLLPPFNALAINDNEVRSDFKRDREAAESFVASRVRELDSRLTHSERIMLNKLKEEEFNSMKELNRRLDLDSIDGFQIVDKNRMRQTVYLYLRPEDLGFQPGDWDNGVKISRDAFQNLMNNFQ